MKKIERIITIASFILALIAIFLSWQSNIIARDQITPKIKIIQPSSPFIQVGSQICTYVVENGTFTSRSILAQQKITLINTGGKPASISAVTFSEEGEYYQSIRVFNPDLDGNLSNERIKFPLILEPGKSIILFFIAETNSLYLLSSGNIATPPSSETKGVWIFMINGEIPISFESPIKTDFVASHSILCNH
jgi:hypothetical protein